MWSTWCSVLITKRTGPCFSASWRIATALVGSWGVSTTTTPAEVTTKLGLQPRISVEVKTLGVTCCTVGPSWDDGPGGPDALFRNGSVPVGSVTMATNNRFSMAAV